MSQQLISSTRAWSRVCVTGYSPRTPRRWEQVIADRLTRSRLRFTAIGTIVVGALLLIVAFLTTTDNRTAATGLGLGSDYMAFYNAATILNHHGLDRLYDLDLQAALYHSNLPGEPETATLPYANAPFLAVMLRPLALIPYMQSYAVWVLLSVALFAAGFTLVWKSCRLPAVAGRVALLVALSFEPFVIECLHGGQVSAFGLVWLCLALYFVSTARPFSAGLALGACLYKPTLLPLILPMLVVTRQWRALAGFAVSFGGLAVLSMATVGPAACYDYLHLLFGYLHKTGDASNAAGLQTWKFVDLNSAMKLLGVPSGAILLVLGATTLVVGASFVRSALRLERNQRRYEALLPLMWATAITWTLVLNVYVGVYDTVLVIPAVIVTTAALLRRDLDEPRQLPLRFRILLAALWVLPWISGLMARECGLQPMTFALLALGAVQLNLLSKRAGAPVGEEWSGRNRRRAVPAASEPCRVPHVAITS